VTGSLILISLLFVAVTPVPNNLLQIKEGTLLSNPLIYITGASDPDSVLYTTGTLFSKVPFKVHFQQLRLGLLKYSRGHTVLGTDGTPLLRTKFQYLVYISVFQLIALN